MALQEQQVSFKFAGGVETKMDSKAVPPVRLLALENGVFTRAISISKRNGYSLLSRAIENSASRISGSKRLASRDDELLLFTSNRCYSKQSSVDQWADVGALIAPIGNDRAAVHTGTAQTIPDHATNNGVTVYAWEDSLGGVWWTTVDATSGRVFRAPTQANANGQRPRCVPVGDGLHVYYAVPTSHELHVVIVNTSQPSAASVGQIVITDLDSTNPVFDAMPTTRTDSPALVAWHEHSTTNIRIGYITTGGVLGSPGNGHPSVYRVAASLAASSPLAVSYQPVDDGVNDVLVLAYMTSTNGVVHLISGGDATHAVGSSGFGDISVNAYTTPVSVQRIAVGVSAATAATIWAAFEEAAAETSNRYTVVNSVTAAGVGTPQTIRSVGLASRAFQAGHEDDVFAVFVHDTTYFNTYMTLRLSDFAPAGRHLPASACGPTRTHLPSVYVDDGVATVSLPYKSRVSSANSDKFTESAIRKVTLDFDSEDTHQTAQLGAGLYMASACPQHYDGYRWCEQGFNMGPEYIPHVEAGGGSLTTASTYQYKVWYEWTDKQGEIHRGPESVGISVSTGANTQCTLTLPMLRVTRKDNARICVARSLPGDTATLYRVTSLDPTTAGAVNGYVANDTSVDSVAFIDRMSDTTLRLQEQMYTVGGILSNDPAPLGSHVAAGRNRLFFIDAQAGNVVRFSQRIATGFGLEIAPELMHDIDPYGGDITALAVMDDVVFVFKASAIFAFNGDGPYETGATVDGNTAQGFSSSQIITSDVGCTDPSSIVLTPQGLLFKSAKGIYLLTRSRDVTYIGAPVEAYNAQAVRRATVLPDRTAVLFLTDSGKSLYFDYLFQQWSTFTNHEGLDAAVVDGTYHYLRAANDLVFRETIGQHSDGGRRIPLRLETAWLHLHEHLQGFQRFWKLLLLGTWVSPHQLAVSQRTSYDEAWSDPYYLDATGDSSSTGWITGDSANTIGEDPIIGSSYGDGNYGDGPYGGTGPDVYQWRYGIHENGQAVQFRFEDFEKAGLAGASFELTEMTIVGGIMKPDARPFSGARST
jgi:hypothetical protein